MHKQIFVDNYVLIHDPNFSLHSSARNTNNKEIYFIFLDLPFPDSGGMGQGGPIKCWYKDVYYAWGFHSVVLCSCIINVRFGVDI